MQLSTAEPPAERPAFGRDMLDMLELSKGLVAYNVLYLVAAWAVAIGAIAVFWAFPHWYTFVPAFVVVASRHQALLNVDHEAIHGKLLPGRRLNNLVGRYLCSAPVGSPYGAARARHLSHHRLLATPEDPDHDLHAGENKRSRRGLFTYFAGGLMGAYAGMVLMGPPPVAITAKDKGTVQHDLLSLIGVQAAIFGGLMLAFDWWVYPALWLAPLATVTVLTHLIRSFVEHAVTDQEMPDHSNRLISIRSNWIERALVAPYGMNWHAEHHLVPSVPAPRLKRLHGRLAGRADLPPMLVRSSYGEAIRRYVGSLPR